MATILIVEPDESFRMELCRAFAKHFRVLACGGSPSAMELLADKPEVLVLSLFLPGMDGLTFLEEAGPLLPSLILCTTVQSSDYVLQAAQELGVGYVMLKPCPVRAVVNRVLDMQKKRGSPAPANPRAVVKHHLDKLGYPPHRDGTRQLLTGVPLFAQDTSQLLGKELYPAIASLWGCRAASIEYSIRSASEDAWTFGAEAWREYFPHHTHCPTNKEILVCLAEFLRNE